MGAMALLTFCVLGLIPIRRIGAALRREITPEDFRYGESARVSGYVSIPNRAMMNLLELPVLFYVICLMSYVTGSVGSVMLYAAWLYVALRILHTAIYLTWNNVLHRLIAFAASNVVLIAMWVLFFVGLGSV
ncbi:membrane protein [Azorhizobium oxalatiphilum]|uniref:Membrane protein n=2 Tax=Azorhizobium oxalatiphilum TaxID=980631 RepID=A0A917BMW3_9HYPH|nr:membrane protein [Azorhizobium oxalatiphilum]